MLLATAAGAAPVRLGVAASLEPRIETLLAGYPDREAVTWSAGPSGRIASQAAAGAFDAVVLATDAAGDGPVVATDTVVWVARDGRRSGRFALADPELAPLGRVALAMGHADWPGPTLHAASASQVVAWLRAGEADAGAVYAHQAAGLPDGFVVIRSGGTVRYVTTALTPRGEPLARWLETAAQRSEAHEARTPRPDRNPSHLIAMLLRTAAIAGVAVGLAAAVAIPWAAWRTRRRPPPLPAALIDGLFLLPVVLPPTVIGLVGVGLLGRRGLGGLIGQSLLFRPEAAVGVAAVVALPLIYVPARAAFAGIDRDLDDAARVHGARGIRLFAFIHLPLARRGIAAGVLLGFSRALGEFGATLMVLGWQPGTETLALGIYAAFERGDWSGAVAPAVILAAAAVALMAGYALLVRRDN